jgi:hypothetical protein
VQSLSEPERWRISLNSARQQINFGRPKVALEILRPIQNDLDSSEGSRECVELPLLIGEALVTDASTDALGYLNTAAERITRIKDPPIDMQIRIEEHIGHFYISVARQPSKAKDHYVAAKQIACSGHCGEDAARIQLKICEIDLVSDNDPQLANFRSLMRLGKAEFTSADIFKAWTLLISTTEGLQKNMKAARNFRSAADSYLLNLLYSVRNENI